MSQGKNKLAFFPSFMVKATLCIAALQYFLIEEYSTLIYSLWLSLVELHQNPCLGSILSLHSDVRSYLLMKEGKKKELSEAELQP